MNLFSYIIAGLIILVASFIRAISGFGYALISTPLLTFIFDARSVVVMNMILGSTTNILVLYHMWKHIDFKRAGFITIGSVIGVPIGAYLLSILDTTIIKLIIAALVIPFSILQMLGHTHRFSRDNVGCVVAGFFSGILAASTSLGGPAVALFLLNQGLTTEKFVGTMAAFFLAITLMSIGAFSTMGLITSDILIRVAIFLPVLIVGSFAGVRVLPKINVVLFKRLTSSILVITAVAIIVSLLVGK
ncbi:sulfite exporter TauE/SafE family protein [Chloroflexota bacterium]